MTDWSVIVNISENSQFHIAVTAGIVCWDCLNARHGDLPYSRHTPRMRGIRYAAASRLNHWRLCNTGSSAGACHRAALCADPLADDGSGRYGFAFPRHQAPGFCQPITLDERVQGMPGACCTRDLACKIAQNSICKCTSLPSAAMLKACFRLALFSWISTAP
jgi:hypothetical protein